MMQDDKADGGAIEFSQDPGSAPRTVPSPDSPSSRAATPKVAAPKEGTVKVPLGKAVVKFPIKMVAHVAAEVTQYPGYNFTEEEADALAAAIAELGYEVPPWFNPLLLAAGLIGGKTIGYLAWKRSGGDPKDPDPSPAAIEPPPENLFAEQAQQ